MADVTSDTSPYRANIPKIQTSGLTNTLLPFRRSNSFAGSSIRTTGIGSAASLEGQLFPKGYSYINLQKFNTYSLNINLQNYYKLDNNFNDSMARQDLSVLSGTPILESAKLGNGLRHPDLNTTVAIPNLVFSGYSFTFAFWFYLPSVLPTNNTNLYTLFSKNLELGLDRYNGAWRLYILDNTSNYVVYNLIFPNTIGWYFIVISYDSTQQRFRFRYNNTLPQTFSHTTGFSSISTNPLYLNGFNTNSIISDAIIDEVGLWTFRVLNPVEEELLWNDSNGRTFVF